MVVDDDICFLGDFHHCRNGSLISSGSNIDNFNDEIFIGVTNKENFIATSFGYFINKIPQFGAWIDLQFG